MAGLRRGSGSGRPIAWRRWIFRPMLRLGEIIRSWGTMIIFLGDDRVGMAFKVME